MTIQIEDIDFDLSPKGYLLNGEDLDNEFVDTCIFGVMPLPLLVGQMKMFLLGDTFLRSYYSVFDFDYQMVRLGVNIHAKNYASMRLRRPPWEKIKI